MRDVAIVGVGMTPFGELWDSSLRQLFVDAAREALEAYARVAGDRSDLGAIAVLNEYVYRPLQAKVRIS